MRCVHLGVVQRQHGGCAEALFISRFMQQCACDERNETGVALRNAGLISTLL